VYFFIGQYMEETSVIIRLLGISVILVSFNSFMGGNRLVPFGYSAIYMRVMVNNCLFFMTGITLLLLTQHVNLYTMTVMVVSVEFFCFVTLIYRNWCLELLGFKKRI